MALDAKELRDKTPDQLRDELVSLKKEAFNLRFRAATGQNENTARMRAVRRDVARVIRIATHRLDSDLPPEVSHHLLVGTRLFCIFRIFFGALDIIRLVCIKALEEPSLAAGEPPQDIVAHLIAAIVADVLGINEDTDSQT